MRVPIPPEFEQLARERVAAGAIASVDEAVARVLLEYVARHNELRALIDEGLASPALPFDRESFMKELRERMVDEALT